MPCETKTREIGGRKWSCTQMPATMALEIETEIAPVLLQAVVPVIATLGQDDDVQADMIAQSLKAATETMPPKQMADLILRLCNPDLVFVEGEGVQFDKDFAGGGGVALRYQVVWFVLETNFSDFFGSLLPAGVLDRAQEKFREKLRGKLRGMASTGASGGPA